MVSSSSRGTVAERFWPKVRKSVDGCWIFTGSRDTAGHGVMRGADRRGHGAHRVSWELVHGTIPDGAWVLHKCDVRPCVRPDHLYLGDHAQNMADMRDRKRARCAKITHCPQGHEYTAENTCITADTHPGRRKCRRCAREYMRRRRARAREASASAGR